MYCRNCGKKLSGTEKFCTECLRPLAQATPIAESGAVASGSVSTNKSKKRKIIIGIIIAAVIIIAAAIVLAITLSRDNENEKSDDGYENLIAKYINIYYYQSWKESDIRPLAPDIMWEDWVDSDESGIDEMFENWEENNEDYYEEYNEKYDVNVDYEITQEVELSDDELQALCDELEDYYDANYPEFDEGYSFKLKIEGEISSKGGTVQIGRQIDDTENLIAVKIDGEWYLVYVDDGYCWLVDYVM